MTNRERVETSHPWDLFP